MIENPTSVFRSFVAIQKFVLALFGIWCVYLVLNLYLYQTTEIRHFETEGYITSMTTSEAWEFANRPIVVPMLYKAAQNYGLHIVRFQYTLSILAWTFLAIVITTILNNRFLSVIAFALILAFSLSLEVYFWNSMLLSESISHSLMILLLGLLIWLGFGNLSSRTQHWVVMLTLILSIMWGFTRDANTYLLLVWGGGLAFWAGYSAHSNSWRLLAIAYILCLAFVVQYRHAEHGKRWQLSYINILGERILPDSEATAFFAERGLPLNDDVTRYTNHRGWAFFPDHDMRIGLDTWLDAEGRIVYAEYLASRPFQTLTAPISNWKAVLAYQHRLGNLGHMYETPTPVWQRLIDTTLKSERLVLPAILIGILALLVIDGYYTHDPRYLIPLIMLFCAYILALVAWHGDADSVERHAFQSTILVRLAQFFVVLICFDRISRRKAHQKSIVG